MEQIYIADKSDKRPDTTSARRVMSEKCIILCRSDDSGANLDGYYTTEEVVNKRVYLHVKLLEEKLAKLLSEPKTYVTEGTIPSK